MSKPTPALEGEYILTEANQDSNRQKSGDDSIYDDLGLGKSKSIVPLSSQKGCDTDQKLQIPLDIHPRIDEIPKQSSSLTPDVQQVPIQEQLPDTSRDSTPHPKLSSSNDPKMTILVAEDNPVNSKILEKRLSKAGHTVHLTSNGDACIKAFSTGDIAFHAILMDVQVRTNSLIE